MSSNNYRQVRITLTESKRSCHPGHVLVTARVMVKPLDKPWHWSQTVLTSSVECQPPLASLDAVYETILELLATPPLPEVTRG